MPAVTAPLHLISLDQLQVASPCSARWDDMEGDARKRLCQDCGLHVHNISEMTRDQAEGFLSAAAQGEAKGARVCVRMYKRADGTVLTQNCPVGLTALRRKVWTGVRRAAAALALCGVSLLVGRRAMADANDVAQGWGSSATNCRAVHPFAWISKVLGKERAAPSNSFFVMGRMSFPSPPTLPQHVNDLMGLPRDREEF